MTIKDLEWGSDTVSWSYNGKTITKKYPNIDYADDDINEGHIYLTCGNEGSEDQKIYLDLQGEELFSADEKNGVVSWKHEGGLFEYKNQHLNQALPYFSEQRVLLLLKDENHKQVLLGFNIDGEKRFETEPPAHFSFYYLSETAGKPSIVCEGDRLVADQFGRNSWHFLIDLETGELVKGELAY